MPDQKLFGIEEGKQQLLDALMKEDRPWLISVEGIGGLGKTSLAYTLIDHLIDEVRFVDIGWVSAKQEEFLTGQGIQPINRSQLNANTLVDQLLAQLSDGPYPISNQNEKRTALTQLLKERPYFIVIDNLETVEDYQILLPLLRTLANPTKFLITSRMSLKNEGDVFCYPHQSLSEENTILFLQHEAKNQMVGPLIGAARSDLLRIYQIVGGNPLALKMVIGQAHFLPIDLILNNLQLAQDQQAQALYTYIYWQAWQMLDENGRKLLITLPIVPSGTFAQLSIASQLDSMSLQNALKNLLRLSLIEISGDVREPRYRLHRLTESFLMNEVVRWQDTNLLSKVKESEFFTDQIQTMLTHWQENHAVEQVDFEILDKEKEGILKAINLGLQSKTAWSIMKTLIFSFSSYMERRGYWQEWQNIIEEATEIATELNDSVSALQLITLRGRILQRQYKNKAVIQNYYQAIKLARRAKDKKQEGRISSNLGFALIETGNLWRSKIFSCHALTIFDEIKYTHGQAATHNHLGLLYLKQKDLAEAEKHLQTACRIWEEQADHHSLIYGLENLGLLFIEMDQPKQAESSLLTCLKFIEETGENGELPNVYLNLSIAYEKLNALDNAEFFVRQAEQLNKDKHYLLGVCKCWEVLGNIYKKSGDKERATDYLEASLEGYQELKEQERENKVLETLATLHI